MKSRDAVIGFIFLVVLIAGALLIFRNRDNKKLDLPTPTPTVSERINQTFPNLQVPNGASRADLNNVSGGEGLGVATKQKTNGSYNITVMANLPEPQNGSYIAELSNGSNKITLGKLTSTKSGFLVDFTTNQDISSYNKVIISLNGTSVLEGSF